MDLQFLKRAIEFQAHNNKRAVKNLEEVRKKLVEGENPMNLGYKPTNLVILKVSFRSYSQKYYKPLKFAASNDNDIKI